MGDVPEEQRRLRQDRRVPSGLIYFSSLWRLFFPRPSEALAPPYTLEWSLAVGVATLGFACAIAYWKMKRWGIVGLGALGLVNFVTILATFNLRAAILTVLVFRVIPLLPAPFRWHAMTWR